jgi:hypothetical protein
MRYPGVALQLDNGAVTIDQDQGVDRECLQAILTLAPEGEPCDFSFYEETAGTPITPRAAHGTGSFSVWQTRLWFPAGSL